MASKTMSRILNRMNDSLCSFDYSDDVNDSFTSFHFDDNNEKVESDFPDESEITETEPINARNKDSFVKQCNFVSEHFEKEKKYLGTITEIDHTQHVFSAEIMESDDYFCRNIVFSMDDIPPEDIQYIEIGRRIIYIYGKQYRNGTAINESKIYFRKEGNWTEREIELKKKEAELLYNLLCKKVEEND